jgi:hypothetical protein
VKVVGHVLFSHVMQMMLMAIFHFIAPLCGVRYDGDLESVYVFPTQSRLIDMLFYPIIDAVFTFRTPKCNLQRLLGHAWGHVAPAWPSTWTLFTFADWI